MWVGGSEGPYAPSPQSTVSPGFSHCKLSPLTCGTRTPGQPEWGVARAREGHPE